MQDRIFSFNSRTTSCASCWKHHWSHLNLITQYIIQWMCQMCKAFDEVAIVPCQSTECPYLGVSLWHGKLFDGMHILLTWVNSFTGDMMHKVYYLCLEEEHLAGFNFRLNSWKHSNTTHRCLRCCSSVHLKDDHIIQIDDAIGQIELSQCILHQTLECRRCITQSKGHPGKFIK